jgi:glutamate dehydrogenase (NAD(P)+)
MKKYPYLSITHYNEKYGIHAFLVIDRLIDGLAAGGLRVSKDVNTEILTSLAKNMTDKQAIAGIKVGGAKAGIDMDPDAPYREDVLRDFFLAIRPIILDCFSVGPDMNTNLRELENIARSVAIPSLKIAVADKKGLTNEEFLKRYALLESKVGTRTVNQLRAAMGVFSALFSLLTRLSVNFAKAEVAIQGAGNIGEPVAQLLFETGAKVIGWADERKCLYDESGLDVKKIISNKRGNLLPELSGIKSYPSHELFFLKGDVLVLAAVSNAISKNLVEEIQFRGIVEAANLALSHEVEAEFHRKNILIIPDVIAGVGGSIAIQSLYDGTPNNGKDILNFVEERVNSLSLELLDECLKRGKPPRQIVNEKLAKI